LIGERLAASEAAVGLDTRAAALMVQVPGRTRRSDRADVYAVPGAYVVTVDAGRQLCVRTSEVIANPDDDVRARRCRRRGRLGCDLGTVRAQRFARVEAPGVAVRGCKRRRVLGTGESLK
jgi:hypothetical protein